MVNASEGDAREGVTCTLNAWDLVTVQVVDREHAVPRAGAPTDLEARVAARRSMLDRGLNPDWLEDHHAHQEALADCLQRPLTPPRPSVVATMADVARGDHSDLVQDLLGAMLRTTPQRLFADRPDVRELVYRAVAEQIVEPDSIWHEDALNHLEARTRGPQA